MSDNQDAKLDALLRARKLDTASPDLAQRIILRAQALPQNRSVSLWQTIKQICAEFHLPKPAYLVASALIIGVAIGYSAPQTGSADNDDDIAGLQNILSADEGLL
jgi:hypothetical protein